MENREIPNGWRETTLGEVAEIIMGQSPKGESYNIDGDGIPFYQGVTEFNDKYVAIKTFTNQPTKIVEPNTILFSVRAPVGRVNFTKHKSCIGRGNAGFTIKNGSQEFLYYLLIHIENYIKSHSSGTVFSSISGKELKEIKVIIPSTYEEQVAIGQVLSSLDEKIELLQEENKTLETLAQTIFTEWFVNFNFPGASGEMEDSELGEIPKGWKVGGIKELVEHMKKNVKPFDFPERIYEHYSLPAFDTGKVPLLETGKMISSNKYTVEHWSFLVSKLNPSNPRIWTVFNKSSNAICSTEFQVIKPLKKEFFGFVYGALTSYMVINELSTRAHGTSSSHQRVKPEDILNVELFVPTIDLIEEYSKLTNQLLIKAEKNINQIQTLKTTRDTLLPKLTTGAIRVEGFGEL